ncbi:hypothetical protein BC938DRAFT_476217 [Jimgerdemannia flammicorona]|uniref:RING-type E3 ubiquitin transferase n=1 Tax=Jimgerdemannia flammicorona TaxID=994334 RepID=A0A433QQS9_9FUNG|nr:hypothetical protein BC938DRAFT_476217 [Jimgerdemannia flammicorona]
MVRDCLAQDERLSQIESIFEQADENLKKRDVPDYFVDKISFNIMHVIVRFVINLVYPDCFFVPLISVLFSCQLLHLDPVITTSGITYERDSLRNHFRRIGYFDPLTRRPCTEEALIPNLSLKEAIEDFIIKNGWAADY